MPSFKNNFLSPFALLTVENTQKMDEAAGDQLEILMENAGRLCGDIFCSHVPAGKRVLIAAGAGNNGGDGYVMARYLKERGYTVAVAPWQTPKTTLAQKAAEKWQGEIVPFLPEAAAGYDWVVDAVFGAGFQPARKLPQEVSALFQAAKSLMAVDMPSGISGDTGKACADVPDYKLTVAFLRQRPGHLLEEGGRKCGLVQTGDIGMPQEAIEAAEIKIFHNQPGLWQLPLQASADNHYHKYSRGVVNVIGGTVMPGAARLSAAGARRSGAGIVRVAAKKEAALPFLLDAPGLIVDTAPLSELVKEAHRKVWVCGPGLTAMEAGEAFEILKTAKAQVVADAGLLGWAAGDPSRLKGACLLTPHAGEFAKLFGSEGGFDLKSITADRVAAVRKAAELTGAVVLLKGEETIIAHPDGRVAVNIHATPALATAGSGDVLSGVAAMCLAAGMESWAAACAAAWLHGEAGQQAARKEGGWPIAEDVAKALGTARQEAEELQKGFVG